MFHGLCSSNDDCVLIFDGNTCISGCGQFSINVADEAVVEANLREDAAVNCTTCPTAAPLECPRLGVACIDGVCTTRVPRL